MGEMMTSGDLIRVISPHCGIATETTSGGETYERELLGRLSHDPRIALRLIVARNLAVSDGIQAVVQRTRARHLPWWRARWVFARAIRFAWLHTGPCDLLRVHSLRYVGPAAIRARRTIGRDWGIRVPVVGHHHHVDRDLLTPWLEGRVLPHLDHVIVPSEFSRQQLATELGEWGPVSVVPNGISERFHARGRAWEANGDPTVLWVGGMKRRKHVDGLLRIWQGVAQEHRTAVLVLVGDGPERPRLERLARRLGIAHRVRFAGYMPWARLPIEYRVADLFVFPSRLEGFGLSVGEAMASGLPVVVSNQGALPELVEDGEGGAVIDPDVPELWVRQILWLFAHPEVCFRWGQANAERIERHFRWPRAVDAIRRIYEDTIQAHRVGVGR